MHLRCREKIVWTKVVGSRDYPVQRFIINAGLLAGSIPPEKDIALTYTKTFLKWPGGDGYSWLVW